MFIDLKGLEMEDKNVNAMYIVLLVPSEPCIHYEGLPRLPLGRERKRRGEQTVIIM